jgi:hypothetical protein
MPASTVPVIIDALRIGCSTARPGSSSWTSSGTATSRTRGWEVFDSLLRATGKALRRMLGTVFATEDFVAVNRAGGSDFYVFTTLETADDALARFQRKARQVEESLRGILDESFGSRIHKRIGVFVGNTVIQSNPQMRVERLVYRALRQAIVIASTKEGERQARLRETFKEILRRRRIRTVFQPIFDLTTMEVYGHEALTRGPVDTAFESPELLFDFAGEHEATWDLEQLCIEVLGRALLGARLGSSLPERRGRFGHGAGVAPSALAAGHLKHRVILEVTERSAIRDVPVFREALGPEEAGVPDRDRRRRVGVRLAPVDRQSARTSSRSPTPLVTASTPTRSRGTSSRCWSTWPAASTRSAWPKASRRRRT